MDNFTDDASPKAAVPTCEAGVGRKFYIELGAFAPRLAEQEVGRFLSAQDLDRYQLMADSLTVVIVHGLVPNIAGNRGRDRLAKKIIKALRPSLGTPTPPLQVGTPAQAESPGDEVQKGKP